MKVVSLCCACWFALTAHAGTITGTVVAESKSEAEQGGGGRYDSRKFKFVEKVNYSELRDFLVFIEGPVSGVTNPAPVTRSVVTTKLTQRDAAFKPHILPVAIGTKVEWPNEDDIFHNVFSMSEPKLFDLGLYKGNPPEKTITFDKAGRVDVFCSIHSQMHCVVLVVENPFFSVTDARGRYTITDVPAGSYKLKAWHERLPPQSQDITVPDSGEVKVNFTLGVKNLPKY
ncbi:MAG TPA: carboxypeptidase regulatory-like domain-containing protein [Candidatus Acidoferrum sp.]|nr:carboxypeptidase regulatory-like domain-containing protein [Candidatus Acidoferrum sp.]